MTEAEKQESLDFILVRRYADSDYDEVTELSKQDDPTFVPLTRNAMNDLISRGDTGLVATTGNKKLIGCVFTRPLETSLLIHNLVVDARFQRNGVATALIGLVEEMAQATGEQELEIVARNGDKRLIRFYEGFGFKLIENSPGVMRKKLRQPLLS